MDTERGQNWPLVLALGVAAGLVGSLALLRLLDVVEVVGASMAPALLPGDRLLVERVTLARRSPRPGDVVLAADPRDPERELIKRVHAVADATVDLRGDAGASSTDSRAFGAVPLHAVRWRAAARYWPPQRIGPIPGGTG